MKFLIRFKVLLIICFSITTSSAQTDFQQVYNKILCSNLDSSRIKMLEFAESKNSYNFMAMGYYLNANNIMYGKTKNIEYLRYNLEVIDLVLLKDNSYLENKWVLSVNRDNQNFSSNGKLSLVSEGYFFRYLGEFLNIISENEVFVKKQYVIKKALLNSYRKWEMRSLKRYNDMSLLYHERFHIGANWAVVALYLYKFTQEKKYKHFYTEFDLQLKASIQILERHDTKMYVWYSSYPDRFTKGLSAIEKYPYDFQDVTHGNHVVNYIITAYELNLSIWTKEDISILSNTLKNIIWNKETNSFSDYVNGKNSAHKYLINTGWKQSDGWMKLMKYDRSLTTIYCDFYSKNELLINNSFLGLQFISNLN